MVERTLHLLNILDCGRRRRGGTVDESWKRRGKVEMMIKCFWNFAQTCFQEPTSSQCTALRTNHKETLPDFCLSSEILLSWMSSGERRSPEQLILVLHMVERTQILMLLNCRRRRRRRSWGRTVDESWQQQLRSYSVTAGWFQPWSWSNVTDSTKDGRLCIL